MIMRQVTDNSNLVVILQQLLPWYHFKICYNSIAFLWCPQAVGLWHLWCYFYLIIKKCSRIIFTVSLCFDLLNVVNRFFFRTLHVFLYRLVNPLKIIIDRFDFFAIILCWLSVTTMFEHSIQVVTYFFC